MRELHPEKDLRIPIERCRWRNEPRHRYGLNVDRGAFQQRFLDEERERRRQAAEDQRRREFFEAQARRQQDLERSQEEAEHQRARDLEAVARLRASQEERLEREREVQAVLRTEQEERIQETVRAMRAHHKEHITAYEERLRKDAEARGLPSPSDGPDAWTIAFLARQQAQRI
jgi:hypothetical protein